MAMTQTLILYHNPRCSKSRQALELLQQQGCALDVVRYLETGLTLEALRHVRHALGLPVAAWIRWKEEAACLVTRDAPEETLLQALVEHPILLERPILLAGDKAVIGRPPEQVLTLLARKE